MDSTNQIPPQEPENTIPSQASSPVVESQQPFVASTPPPKSKKKLLITIVLVILLIIVVIVGWLVFTKNDSQNNSTKDQQKTGTSQDSSSKPVEQVFISPIDGSKTIIVKGDYYQIKAHEIIYYGQMIKINDNYYQVFPTVYMKSGKMVLTVDDFHEPETETFFNSSEITNIKKIDDEKTLNALAKLLPGIDINNNEAKVAATKNDDEKDSSPINTDIDSYLRKFHYKAFLLRDGAVVYANVSSLEGNFLVNAKHVYLLKGNSPQQTLFADKPENYSKLDAKDIVYWQNINQSSPIAKAAANYEKAYN